MKKINKPVYNLLKESEIRRLLRELDLPVTGDREVKITPRMSIKAIGLDKTTLRVLDALQCRMRRARSKTDLPAQVRVKVH